MKDWLQNRFLPMWAKETVLWDNRHLERENARLQKKVEQLEAYIRGLQMGLRVIRHTRGMNAGGEK
jgi:hypothetical protein